MRIAQVAPLQESVPPKMYGGTERVVACLTEALVARGHDVTLFASGDSQTSATLVRCCEQGLRLDRSVKDFVAHTMIELGKVYGRAKDFDVIHNHVDYFAFPFARLSETPTLTTLHGALDLPEVQRVHEHFKDVPLVSISDAQRTHLPRSNWIGTVHNAIQPEQFPFRAEHGSYLAFLGRISPEKRVDRAIEVARAVGIPLKIAAKVDAKEAAYFEHAIKPQLRHPLVEFVGEICEAQKGEFLGNALAYLFPIDWPEPFGVTMIESLATGTPVLAMDCGSVREVIDHGRTGFICRDIREMIDAVSQVRRLSREDCRRDVEARFDARGMAARYEALYRRVLSGEPGPS